MFSVLRVAVCIEIVGQTGGEAGEAGFSRVFLALVISSLGLVHRIDYLSCT